MISPFIRVLFALIAVIPTFPVTQGSRSPQCKMQPAYLRIQFPDTGMMWIAGSPFKGDCKVVPSRSWIRKPLDQLDLLVYADGPTGSGRYWDITIGIAGKNEPKPYRGICLETSTVGWRTLREFKKEPLSWIDDLNADGRAEVIIWDSFSLGEEATNAEFGLVAWVYQVEPRGVLAIDWDLSRKMARQIANAYRTPLKEEDSFLQELRNRAAHELELFADNACASSLDYTR